MMSSLGLLHISKSINGFRYSLILTTDFWLLTPE